MTDTLPFTAGDRVTFTAEAIDKCDPAISRPEIEGTVLHCEPVTSLTTVQFDDGETLTYPGRFLQKLADESPIA